MGSRCHRRSKRAVFVVLLLAAGCTLHMTLFVLQNSYQNVRSFVSEWASVVLRLEESEVWEE